MRLELPAYFGTPRLKMTDAADIELTIDFNDPEASSEKLEKLTQSLWQQMRALEGVRVERVLDPNPPEGNRSLGAFLLGVLNAEVSVANLKMALEFLNGRLSGKPIKIKGSANGREVEIEVRTQADLLVAEQVLSRLLPPE